MKVTLFLREPFNQLLLMPHPPGGFGLEVEHFETVLYGRALGAAFFHEESFEGVVDEVVEEVLGREKVVGNVGTGLRFGVHSQRGAVYYHLVAVHQFGGEVGVGKAAGSLGAADVDGVDAELAQAVDDGFRRAARAENECAGVDGGAEERTDGRGEANDVGVAAEEFGRAVSPGPDANNVDRPDGARLGREAGQEGHDGLLVGDGHVEAPEAREAEQVVDGLGSVGKFEVGVRGVDMLALELFGKVARRKAVAERIA